MDLEDFNNKRPGRAWLMDERLFKERSWVIVILICVIVVVIHGLFIFILYLGWNGNLSLDAVSQQKKAELFYELAYNESQIERYVETNSTLVPEDSPEKTNNFGAQSQQAAQEMLADSWKKDNAPTIDGEDEIFSKIVEGFEDPEEGIAGVPDLIREEEVIVVLEEKEESVVGLKVRPKPRPRPRIKKLLVGALNKHDGGAEKMGPVAVDARFSQFGTYLEKMFEAIRYQGMILFSDYSPTAADLNCDVLLSYSLDENGNVSNLKVEFATASNLAIILCKDSILSQAPFGAWTEEMKMVLGKEQKINFGFRMR